MKLIFIAVLGFMCSFVFAQSSEFYATFALLGNGNPGNGQNRLYSPFGLAIHPNGDTLYFANQGSHLIKKYSVIGANLSVLAGDTIAGYKDSISIHARFNSPSNLCVDDSGNVYVSDFNNHRIRKISPGGMVSTIAGSGIPGYLDGAHDSARFHFPRGIAVDDSGNVFVSDSWNHRIRKISKNGLVSTYAGGGTNTGVGSIGSWVDGQDTTARFYTPSGLFYFKSSKTLFVADAYNHRIRHINQSGLVGTLVGTGPIGPGNGGFINGNLNNCRFNTPTELFVEQHPDGNNIMVYISDTYNNQIREFNSDIGLVYTIVGDTVAGYIEGWGTNARLNYPRGLVIRRPYFIYFCDYNNHLIRAISHFWESTDEDAPLHSIKIWPQPTSSTLHFSEEIQSLNIYDATGKLIHSQSYPIGIHNLLIQDWSPGLYRITGTSSSGYLLNQSCLIQK